MKTYLKYGLYYAAGSILWTLLTYVTGIDRMEHGNLIGLISIVIPVSCIYLGIKEMRDTSNNGFINYGKAFKLGISITAVAMVIYSGFAYLYFSYINPGMIEFVKSKQYEAMQERGMDEFQIEKQMGYAAPFMTPAMFTFWAVIFTLLIGILISLILAAILKRPDPEEIS